MIPVFTTQGWILDSLLFSLNIWHLRDLTEFHTFKGYLSPTQWTWIWANSRREWRTEKPGMLQYMESQSHTQFSNWITIKNTLTTQNFILPSGVSLSSKHTHLILSLTSQYWCLLEISKLKTKFLNQDSPHYLLE